MADKDTAPVRARRDTEKDSGPVDANEARAEWDGKKKVGTIRVGRGLIIAALLAVLSIGGVSGISSFVGTTQGVQSSAPDAAVVEATANAVIEIKDSLKDGAKTDEEIKIELVKLNASLSGMNTNAEYLQKQIDAQQDAIEALKVIVPTVREMDDLRARVKALEDARK